MRYFLHLQAEEWPESSDEPFLKEGGYSVRIVYRNNMRSQPYAGGAYQITVDGSSFEPRPPIRSRRLPFLLQQALELLIAEEAQGKPITPASLWPMFHAIGRYINAWPHAHGTGVINHIYLALHEQTQGGKAYVKDLANRAYTLSRGNPAARGRLEELLRQVDMRLPGLLEYRRNLQRQDGSVRVSEEGRRLNATSPYPPGIVTPEERLNWLLRILAQLIVSLPSG
jgi:hypothetical protein